MSNIFRLSDPPTVHAQTKTTIVDGVIQRKLVWKDTRGHEYEKVNGKLQLPGCKQVQIVEPVAQPEFDMLLFCCALSVLTMIFLCGVAVGTIRRNHSNPSVSNPSVSS